MNLLPASIRQRERWLASEPINVAPQLLGLPLATPGRRLLAMVIDLVLIGLLSDVDGLWLVAALALVALLLRGPLAGKRKRVMIGWAFAAVLGVLALHEVWTSVGPHAADRRASRVAEQAAEQAAEKAAEQAAAQREEALAWAQQMRAQAELHKDAARHEGAASAAVLSDAQRIAALRAEVAALRKPRPFEWRRAWDRLLASVGLSFGWGLVYFSLLPAWWNGQTLGKKLLRLRVVELTGKALTVMRCLRRYGGYAAGMATGGFGFLQALWDPNRQAVQDRVAHTVVVDERAAAAGRTDAGAATPLSAPPAPVRNEET